MNVHEITYVIMYEMWTHNSYEYICMRMLQYFFFCKTAVFYMVRRLL